MSDVLLAFPAVLLAMIFATMLQEARGYIRSDAWFGVCPGLTIVIMVLALNRAADNMAKRADPRSAVRRMRQSGL